MTLDPCVAYAAGLDAGNRSMRAAGRTAWSEADHAAACRETRRLMAVLYADAGYPAVAAEIAV